MLTKNEQVTSPPGIGGVTDRGGFVFVVYCLRAHRPNASLSSSKKKIGRKFFGRKNFWTKKFWCAERLVDDQGTPPKKNDFLR